MKSTIQAVFAVALIAMLLSGCRTRSRSNTPTNATTMPTTTPTTAVTTLPETQATTQPITTAPTTNVTTETTTGNELNPTDQADMQNTTPNSRSGMTGQTSTAAAPGNMAK